jgi:hypothetical protein
VVDVGVRSAAVDKAVMRADRHMCDVRAEQVSVDVRAEQVNVDVRAEQVKVEMTVMADRAGAMVRKRLLNKAGVVQWCHNCSIWTLHGVVAVVDMADRRILLPP